MDACTLKGVRRVSIKKAAQIGVSEFVRNVLGCLACDDPDPAMLNLPNELKGREIIAERIIPMFERTSALAELHTGLARDSKLNMIRLVNGFVLWLAWSGSATSLASHPIRYLVNDEVNKFALLAGGEADPLALAEQRVKTYEGKSLIFDISSPTYRETGISRLVRFADVELHYFIPCPHCHKRIELTWDTVRYRKHEDLDPTDTHEWARRLQSEQAAWYECPECGQIFGEREKPGLVRQGFWASRRQIDDHDHVDQDVPMGAILLKGLGRPRHIGMVIESMPALWVRCWDLAAKWVRVQHDPNLLMDFVNGDCGRDFERQITTSKAGTFEAKCTAATWGPLKLPAWTGRLLATVDVQADHAWVVIRAWGPGLRSRRIWHGCVAWITNDPRGGEELRRIAFGTLYPFEGADRPAVCCDALAIDTGYRTEEMYQFGQSDPRLYLFKGGGKPQVRLAEPRRATYSPPGEQNPWSIWFHLLDSDRLKDWLAAAVGQRIHHGEGDDLVDYEQWELNNENDPVYNRQMASEHKVMMRKPGRGLIEAWVLREGISANHYWDCECYQRALAFILNVELLDGRSTGPVAAEPGPDPLTMPDGRPFLITER
jgi:phage terminase large subunit GpA-like protein